MIKALKLAKVPTVIIKAIEQLCHQCETILHIKGPSEDIITETIRYLSGIFQGNSLSVLLFILSVNPLSFTSKPVISKPVISKPVISKPVVSKPVISKPVISKPVVLFAEQTQRIYPRYWQQ